MIGPYSVLGFSGSRNAHRQSQRRSNSRETCSSRSFFPPACTCSAKRSVPGGGRRRSSLPSTVHSMRPRVSSVILLPRRRAGARPLQGFPQAARSVWPMGHATRQTNAVHHFPLATNDELRCGEIGHCMLPLRESSQGWPWQYTQRRATRRCFQSSVGHGISCRAMFAQSAALASTRGPRPKSYFHCALLGASTRTCSGATSACGARWNPGACSIARSSNSAAR